MIFQTLVHALFLVSPSLEDLAVLVASAPWWVTDQGTEFGTSHIMPVPMQSIFPYMNLQPQEPLDNLGEIDFELPPPPCGLELKIDLRRSLDFNGTLHASHNAGRGLEHHLKYYKEAVFRLGKVSALMSRKQSKDRLFQTCFAGTPVGRQMHLPLKQYHYTCHVERWGTVAKTCLETTDEVERKK